MEPQTDQISEMIDSFNGLSPDALGKLKKVVFDKKDQIMKEMKRKGIKPKEIKEKFIEGKKKLLALTKPQTKKAVIITPSRQMKTKNVPVNFTVESANSSLNAISAVGMTCSQLCIGNLSEKTIKIWYDPTISNKNKRATKIAGFEIGGSLLITCDEGDLTEEDLSTVEQLL